MGLSYERHRRASAEIETPHALNSISGSARAADLGPIFRPAMRGQMTIVNAWSPPYCTDVLINMGAVEATLKKLSDERDIRAVLARYCHAVDRADFEMLSTLFHVDAEISYGNGVYEGDGAHFPEALLTYAAAMKRSHHMLGVTMIDLNGEIASCETYAQATHIQMHEGALVEITSGHRYLDRLERREDNLWRIARRIVVVDWLRRLQANESLFAEIGELSVGARGSEDPFYAFMAGNRLRR